MFIRWLAGIAGILAPVQSVPVQQPPALERSLEAYLAPLTRTNNFSGVILVAKGDRVIFQKAYGLANLEHAVPNRPSTIFQIASVSKPFTSAAILLLVEQGKLGLHAPLEKVLPGYPNGGKLTVHHLLTHTSGIPNINDFDDYADVQRRPHGTEALVARFRDKPLDFEPGARFSYSNSNFNLLAHIIERVTRQSFGKFLDEAIFRPLKLGNIAHPTSMADVVPGMATGYAPVGSLGLERATYVDWSVKTGNGSLRSDAAGLMRFFRAVHSGRLLNPQSLATAFTPHTPNVGYGWFLTETNGRRIHHANGRSPGWAAQADYYVDDQVTVVVLANTYVSVTTPIARAVGALYFGKPVTPMPALSPAALAPSVLRAVIGNYQFGPDYYVPNAKVQIREKEGQVEAMIDGGGPYPFVSIDGSKFLIRSFWVPAEFAIGGNGRASGLTIDGLKGERLP